MYSIYRTLSVITSGFYCNFVVIGYMRTVVDSVPFGYSKQCVCVVGQQ